MAESENYKKSTEIRRKLMGEKYADAMNKSVYADPMMQKFGDYAREAVFGMRDKVKSNGHGDGHAARERARRAVEQAREQGGHTRERLGETAGQAGSAVREAPHRATERTQGAPLAAGLPGFYRRYDWDRDELAELHAVEPSDLLVLEGVGSGSRELASYRGTLVWVTAGADLRLERGLDRDGDGAVRGGGGDRVELGPGAQGVRQAGVGGAPVHRDHAPALLEQQAGRRRADAAGRAGDQRDPVHPGHASSTAERSAAACSNTSCRRDGASHEYHVARNSSSACSRTAAVSYAGLASANASTTAARCAASRAPTATPTPSSVSTTASGTSARR